MELLDEIEQKVINREVSFNDLRTLNNKINIKTNYIMYVNIRSLNVNFDKLKILVKTLLIKPYIIVCSESWNLEHYIYFTLSGYDILYNHRKINQANGLVVYIKKKVTYKSEVIEIGRLKILHTVIKLNKLNVTICPVQNLF